MSACRRARRVGGSDGRALERTRHQRRVVDREVDAPELTGALAGGSLEHTTLLQGTKAYGARGLRLDDLSTAGRVGRGRRERHESRRDVWRTLFARLASMFGMALVDEPVRVAEEMPRHADVWRRIARRESLRIADLDELVGLSWQYADMLWANPRRPQPVPSLVSTIKARQLGFGDCIVASVWRPRSIMRRGVDSRVSRLCP